MLVLLSRYSIEPSALFYYTDKNKGSTSTTSLKSAKRFKSVVEIQEHFKEHSWEEHYTVRSVKYATNPLTISTSEIIGEFKPTNPMVIRLKWNNYFIYDVIEDKLTSTPELNNAKVVNTLEDIEALFLAGGYGLLANEKWQETFELKGVYYNSDTLILNRP